MPPKTKKNTSSSKKATSTSKSSAKSKASNSTDSILVDAVERHIRKEAMARLGIETSESDDKFVKKHLTPKTLMLYGALLLMTTAGGGVLYAYLNQLPDKKLRFMIYRIHNRFCAALSRYRKSRDAARKNNSNSPAPAPATATGGMDVDVKPDDSATTTNAPSPAPASPPSLPPVWWNATAADANAFKFFYNLEMENRLQQAEQQCTKNGVEVIAGANREQLVAYLQEGIMYEAQKQLDHLPRPLRTMFAAKLGDAQLNWATKKLNEIGQAVYFTWHPSMWNLVEDKNNPYVLYNQTLGIDNDVDLTNVIAQYDEILDQQNAHILQQYHALQATMENIITAHETIGRAANNLGVPYVPNQSPSLADSIATLLKIIEIVDEQKVQQAVKEHVQVVGQAETAYAKQQRVWEAEKVALNEEIGKLKAAGLSVIKENGERIRKRDKRINELQDEKRALEERMQAAQQEHKEAMAALQSDHENALDKLQDKFEAEKKRITGQFKQENDTLEREKDRAVQDKTAADAKIDDLTERLGKLTGAKGLLDIDTARLDVKNTEKQTRIEALERDLREQTANVEAKVEELARAAKGSAENQIALAEIRAQKEAGDKRIADLERDKDSAEDKIRELEAAKDLIQTDLAVKGTRVAAAQATLQEVRAARDELKRRVDDLDNELASMRRQLPDALRADIADVKARTQEQLQGDSPRNRERSNSSSSSTSTAYSPLQQTLPYFPATGWVDSLPDAPQGLLTEPPLSSGGDYNAPPPLNSNTYAASPQTSHSANPSGSYGAPPPFNSNTYAASPQTSSSGNPSGSRYGAPPSNSDTYAASPISPNPPRIAVPTKVGDNTNRVSEQPPEETDALKKHGARGPPTDSGLLVMRKAQAVEDGQTQMDTDGDGPQPNVDGPQPMKTDDDEE